MLKNISRVHVVHSDERFSIHVHIQSDCCLPCKCDGGKVCSLNSTTVLYLNYFALDVR